MGKGCTMYVMDGEWKCGDTHYVKGFMDSLSVKFSYCFTRLTLWQVLILVYHELNYRFKPKKGGWIVIVYQYEDKVFNAIRFYIPLAWNLTPAININEVNLISSIPIKGNIVAAYYLQIVKNISPSTTSLYVHYSILV